jgi:type 1 glutamine amidotransferase
MTKHPVRLPVLVGALSMAMAGATVAAPQAEPTHAEPITSNAPLGAQGNFDVYYNVCRGTDPRCYHPWVEDRQNKVLVYSRTGGPRHANIGTALGPGRNTQNATTFAVTCTTEQPGPPIVRGNCLVANNTAQQALRTWLNAEGIAVDITEDVNQLSNLNQYKAVIFMSPTRDTLWKHGRAAQPPCATGGTVNNNCNTDVTSGAHLDAAKTALRQYMRAGGGFVGIHNAFGTEYNWPYYEGLLGNANYYDHGANQLGTAHVVNADPSMAGLPASFETIDEWYNLMPYPTNVKFLLRLDETSLANRRETHPGHGDFHPVTWCQYYDGGRSWVTTLGHDRRQFEDGSGFAGQQQFKQMVVQGIKSAMGVTPFCTK